MAAISGLVLPLDTSGSTSSQQASSNEGSASLSGIGESDFLKLLVTQLQNQDPMNPVDNNQFVTQLATFSSLEQLMSINTTVSKIADEMTTDTSATLAKAST